MKTVLEQQDQVIIPAQSEICINCGVEVNSPYCGACGQPRRVPKVSWSGLFEEFYTKWFGLDNLFARTVIDLTLRPGKVIRKFLAGNRMAYLGPLTYYFIVTALVLLIMSMLDINMEDLMMANKDNFSGAEPESNARILEFQKKFLHYMAVAFRFLAILMVPFFVLAAMMFYRKQKLNFLEHSIILVYASAQLFWLTLVQGVVMKFGGYLMSVPAMVISILFYGYYYMDIMEEKKGLFKFLKGVAVYIIGMIFMLIGFMFVGVIAGVFMGIFNK